MIVLKHILTLEDFESLKVGDNLAVEWHRDSYLGDGRTRFACYRIVEIHDWNQEIILQKKNNVYFSYARFLEEKSNAKSVTLITSD
ncbi:MAG: hypothetical protein M0P12_03220 [Paludibacteraceae bacterium]|nr:hypothetical protein [Paludibacteraceae bacterium]